MNSVAHAQPLSIGLNCSFGAKDLKKYIKEISDRADCYVSAYPNAGLPNQFGGYDETPETMAGQVKEYIDEQLVNIIGGCCGTTPDHIAAYQQLIDFMTAEAAQIPFDVLQTVMSRIINEVKGVNRVFYDLTSKPPGTIEME